MFGRTAYDAQDAGRLQPVLREYPVQLQEVLGSPVHIRGPELNPLRSLAVSGAMPVCALIFGLLSALIFVR